MTRSWSIVNALLGTRRRNRRKSNFSLTAALEATQFRSLERLESRLVLTDATQFAISEIEAVQGSATVVTVAALDDSGDPVDDYRGTVHFTSTDEQAALPDDYTFTASDAGNHDFHVTFNTLGDQTLTVSDTGDSTLTGDGDVSVSAPDDSHSDVTHFCVQTNDATQGAASTVTVAALNDSGDAVPGYTGTVHFTSTDSLAMLPDDYTFTADDGGSHDFSVTFNTVGNQKLTATDTSDHTITGQGCVTVSAPDNSDSVVTHFCVQTNDAVQGVASTVTVAALNDSGDAVPGYTGTVHFTSTDRLAMLPDDYTFTADDGGSHDFSVTFNTVGNQKLTATDTSDHTITGQGCVSVSAPDNSDSVVTHFCVQTNDTVQGVASTVTVAALNDSGDPVPGYTGTVHFTSTDSLAMLPDDYTFKADDGGSHDFSVTFNTVGNQKLTATDTSDHTITGQGCVTVAEPDNSDSVVTHFCVQTNDAVQGVASTVTIAALNDSGDVVPGYTGTVHFTSTDSLAMLPDDYTFTADDGGSHDFSVTFNTVGNQKLTATDTSDHTITGQGCVTVAAVATHFKVLTPPNPTAGAEVDVTVAALDAQNHLVPSYLGTVHFSSTDNAAVLPENYTFTAEAGGVQQFSMTWGTAGSETLTVTDVAKHSLFGKDTVNVKGTAVATHFSVAAPSNVPAGTAVTLNVVALDASNKPVSNYTGTVHFTSTDGAATLPKDFKFTAADHGNNTFHVTFGSVGSHTLTVTDVQHDSLAGSTTVNVSAKDVATHFYLVTPSNAATGSAVTVKLTALDASNQLVPNYTGTVHFSSTDSSAALPKDFTFTAGDNGSHEFSMTWNKAGHQTLQVTDTKDNTLKGTASVTVAAPGIPTHLQIDIPLNIALGAEIPVQILALDAANHPVGGFTAGVTVTGTNLVAGIPQGFKFTVSVDGKISVPITWGAGGSHSLTVAITVNNLTISGSVSVNVGSADVATHFQMTTTPQSSSGTLETVDVVALDASSLPVTNYAGTVHFTSTDHAASLPADYTFTAADHGHHVFHVTWGTTGPQTLTLKDKSSSTIVGTVNTSVDVAAVATHFLLLAPPNAPVGSSVPLRLVALDASNLPVRGYQGAVHFASTDSSATLPADYVFTAQDHGEHVFHMTWGKQGAQTLAVADKSNASVAGATTVNVGAQAVAAHFLVVTPPQAPTETQLTLKVFAVDAANFPVTGYTGKVHFSSSDPLAVLPNDYTFQAGDKGRHDFQITWGTSGHQTLTVSETTAGGITEQVDVTVRGIERLYRVYNPNAELHTFTSNFGEFSILVSHYGYHDESTKNTGFAVLSSPGGGAVSLHRMYNQHNGQHYLTTSDGERDALLAIDPTGKGWKWEGDQGAVFPKTMDGANEIFMLYNDLNGEHLYTANATERDGIVAIPGKHWHWQTSLGFAYPIDQSGDASYTPPAGTANQDPTAAGETLANGITGGTATATAGLSTSNGGASVAGIATQAPVHAAENASSNGPSSSLIAANAAVSASASNAEQTDAAALDAFWCMEGFKFDW